MWMEQFSLLENTMCEMCFSDFEVKWINPLNYSIKYLKKDFTDFLQMYSKRIEAHIIIF